MHTSPSDSRNYLYRQLSNGLKVVLVSDPNGTKSAASLAVNVGHFDDPPYRQGLAHFLEHMLFLGTEKYPHPGEYQQFINHHGGHHNAWTGTEYTNFFFDIETEWFESGLDRFSQFFIAPTFDAELVEKERQAVHSEYQLKIQDDVRRLYQVHKETVNPFHPFSKFSVGSAETLADWPGQPVRDDLIKFYQQNYSADRMSLVLVSPLSLEQLEQYIELFSSIPQIATAPRETPPLLTDEQRSIFIYARPIKEVRRLTLSFDLPETKLQYRNKPLSFLAHLLGNETAGSLIALLRERGLIQTMAAGGGIVGDDFREFTLSYQLTEAGLDAIDEIVEMSFSFLTMIRREGLAKWRYQEKQQTLSNAFKFQERIRSLDYASHLAMNIHLYQSEDIICGDYLMENYDEAEISAALDYLTPERVRVTLLDREVETNSFAKWYQTPYRVEPLSKEQLEHWNNPKNYPFKLAPKNPFVEDMETNLDSNDQSPLPQIIADHPGYRLWFQQDSEQQIPKGHLYLSVDSIEAVNSVRNIACSRLAIECLIDHLSELTYQAEIAGMNYEIYPHQGGLSLHIAGFSQHQFKLLQMILKERQFGHFDPERFRVVKNQLMEHCHNQQHIKPINRLYQHLLSLLQPANPLPEQLLPALESITEAQMPDFVKRLYQNVHIESFIYGYWSKAEALNMSQYIRQEVAPEGQCSEETPRELVNIGGMLTLTHEVICEHNDSAILIYFQSPSTLPKQIALYAFCNHLMSSTFFYELRTQQQLGYIVGNGSLPLNRHPGMIFYIQSPHATPQQMLTAIDHFLDNFPLVATELSEQEWQEAKQGLISQILEEETTMKAKAKRFWTSIGNKDLHFDRRHQIAEELMKLDKADLVRFTMSLKSHHRDRLVLYSTGLSHQREHHLDVGQPITDRDSFLSNTQKFRY